jgi:hypothetical protein
MTKSTIIKCALAFAIMPLFMADSCDDNSSDSVQRKQQETLLAEGTAQTGMPAIKNFRERKMLKDILELRDQDGLVTYTYIFSQMTGKFTFIGQSIGYGIPYATEYTNPLKIDWSSGHASCGVINQADPNGLFSPAAAEGTWVLMLDPDTGKTRPQYIEERVEVFTYKLPASLLN